MKTKINAILTTLFGVLFFQEVQAQERFLTGSVTTKYNTGYMNRAGVTLYAKPTWVNILDVNFGSDFTAELWTSTALGNEDFNTTSGDEYDVSLSWHHQWNDVRVSLSCTHLFIKDLGRFDDDFWFFEGDLSYTRYKYFQPYVATRAILEVGERSPERGWFGWVGVRSCFKTFFKPVTLTSDVCVEYSDGAAARTPGLVYVRGVIGLKIKLSQCWTVTPSVLLQAPIENQANHPKFYTDRNRAVGSLALKYEF